MWVGALLEIISLSQLPIGAARSWETGPASVAAVSLMAAGPGGPSLLVIAGAYGVALAWIGSWSVHGLRHLNSRLVASERREAYSATELSFRHFLALVVDFARAALFTLAAVAVAGLVVPNLQVDAGAYAGVLLLAVAGLALGVDLRMMARSRRTYLAFAASAVVSGLITVWLL